MLRAVLIALAATPLLAGLCIVLLAAALAVPDAAVARSIAEDAPLFEHKRLYSFTGKKIDVGTECIGVSFGLGDAEERSVFEAAVAAPVIFECADLLAHVRGGVAGTGDYTHYWHGYAVLSRPFLAAFPYHDLRMVTFNLMIISFGLLAIGIARVFGARFAFAALLPFYFVNFSGFLELWTKAAGWLVMLAAANVIVRNERQETSPPWLLFYLLGAGTAFVDLLTTPLLVFGFPAALHLLMLLRERPLTARDQIIRLLLIGCFFALGYVGLWLAKIAIASAVVGPEIWSATAKTAAFRLSGSLDSVKHFIGAATLENLEAFKGLWGGMAIIVFFIAPFVTRAGRRRFADFVRTAPGVIAIAFSPFVWYEILSNHSQIHGLFTHANLVLTFLPLSLVLLNVTGRLAAPSRVKQLVAGEYGS